MKVGVPRETAPGERRVAIVPEVVRRLAGKGVEVVVEPGAGAGALIPDRLFEEAGAMLGDPWEADVVVTIGAQSADALSRLSAGQVLVGFLSPLTSPDTTRALAEAGVTDFTAASFQAPGGSVERTYELLANLAKAEPAGV